jgi:homospermidine synthase
MQDSKHGNLSPLVIDPIDDNVRVLDQDTIKVVHRRIAEDNLHMP